MSNEKTYRWEIRGDYAKLLRTSEQPPMTAEEFGKVVKNSTSFYASVILTLSEAMEKFPELVVGLNPTTGS